MTSFQCYLTSLCVDSPVCTSLKKNFFLKKVGGGEGGGVKLPFPRTEKSSGNYVILG